VPRSVPRRAEAQGGQPTITGDRRRHTPAGRHPRARRHSWRSARPPGCLRRRSLGAHAHLLPTGIGAGNAAVSYLTPKQASKKKKKKKKNKKKKRKEKKKKKNGTMSRIRRGAATACSSRGRACRRTGAASRSRVEWGSMGLAGPPRRTDRSSLRDRCQSLRPLLSEVGLTLVEAGEREHMVGRPPFVALCLRPTSLATRAAGWPDAAMLGLRDWSEVSILEPPHSTRRCSRRPLSVSVRSRATCASWAPVHAPVDERPEYLTDIDGHLHESLGAVDAATGKGVGVRASSDSIRRLRCRWR